MGSVPHLAQNTASRQRRDTLRTIAQDSLQDVLVISPKRWPGALDPCWRPRQPETRSLDRGRAVEWIWQRNKVSTMGQLGVIIQVLTVVHSARWDTTGLQHGLSLLCTVRLRPNRQDRIQGLTMRAAGSQRGKTRVVTKVGTLHDLAERLPLGICVYCNGQPTILASGWIHAMRCQMRIHIPYPLLTMPAHRKVQQCRGEKVQGGLGLRLVDILPLAGAASVFERCQEPDRRETRRHIVCISAKGAGGRAVRPVRLKKPEMAAARLPKPANWANSPLCPIKHVLSMILSGFTCLSAA